MAAASSSKGADSKIDLVKQAVYQKNGNIFFRTTVQKAIASEQKQLDLGKGKLEKLNSR